MKILGKTIGALAMGAALVSAIPAQARPGGYGGGGGYHHGGGGYGGYHGGYGGHRGYRGYRGHGNDAGVAIGAGVLGLALGAIIASDHGDRQDRAYAPAPYGGYDGYQGGYQGYQGGYDSGYDGYQGEDGYPY
jgi:hypothetical protein